MSARLAALALITMVAGPSSAQEVKTLLTNGKWSAHLFQEDAKNVCYVQSKPIKSEGNYRSRGEVLLQVTNRPADKTTDVISVVAGYPYQQDSDALVQVGSRRFTFFTFGESAWTRDNQTDKAIVQAMMKGASLTVSGSSSRGTPTVDTFSLQGFSAAYKAMTDSCK
jgi:invasion protein IalB